MWPAKERGTTMRAIILAAIVAIGIEPL